MSIYNPTNLIRHTPARAEDVNRELAKVKAAFDELQQAIQNIAVGGGSPTLYTWVAWANSPDGVVDFTTEAPGDRTYIGMAFNRLVEIPSNNPSDYQWANLHGAIGSLIALDTLYVAGRDSIQLVTDLDTVALQLLAYQFDAQTLRDYIDARIYVDGQPVNAVIANETNERETSDSALAETIGLIGAATSDGESFILNLNKTYVDPDTTLSVRLSAMQAATENAQATADNVTQLITDGTFALGSDLSLLGAKTLDGTAWVMDLDTVKVSPTETFSQFINSAVAAAAGEAASVAAIYEAVVTPTGGASAKAVLQLDVNGKVVGYSATNDGDVGAITFKFDSVSIEDPNGNPLFVAEGGVVKMPNVEIDTLKAGSVTATSMAGAAVSKTRYAVLGTNKSCPKNVETTVLSVTITKDEASSLLEVTGFLSCTNEDDLQVYARLYRNGTKVQESRTNIIGDGSGRNKVTAATLTPFLLESGLPAGNYTYELRAYNYETDTPTMTVFSGAVLKVIEQKAATVG